MPISFACPQCARAIKAPDNLAGKAGKCPGCGSVFTVPAAHVPPVHAPAARPAPPASAVPPSMPGFASGALPGQPAGIEQPAAFDQPSFAPTAPARRKKSNMMLPLVIGGASAGLLLLVGVAVLAYTMLRGGSTSAMKYLPHDADLFASIRVDDVRNHEAVQLMLKGPQANTALAKMEKEIGLKPADVSQYLFAARADKDSQAVGVIVLNRGIDTDEFVKKLPGTWKEETIGGFKARTKRDIAIVFPDNKTIIAGEPAGVRAALAKDRKAGFNDRLQPLVDSLSLSKSVAFAMAPPAGSLDLPPGAPIDPSMLANIKGVLVEVDLPGDLNIKCDVRCKDHEAADNLRKVVEGLVTMMSGGPQVPAEARESLKSLKVSASGNSMIATATVKKDTLVSLAKQSAAVGGRTP